jgi:hypothetical protein
MICYYIYSHFWFYKIELVILGHINNSNFNQHKASSLYPTSKFRIFALLFHKTKKHATIFSSFTRTY